MCKIRMVPFFPKNILLICTLILSISKFGFSQPVIHSFLPSSGPVGTNVVITGNNFSTIASDNIVYFGMVRATVMAATTTQLTVQVPVGATYQRISITVNAMTAYSSKIFKVTFSGAAAVFTSRSFVYAARVDSVDQAVETTNYSLGDFDNDGKVDVVTVDRTSNSMTVYKNLSVGEVVTFASGLEFVTGQNPRAVAVGDVDCDGKMDIIVSNFVGNSVSVFKNTSVGSTLSFSPKLDFPTNSQPAAISVTDLDKDGKPDLVVNTVNVDGYISLLRNTSNGGTISFAPRTDLKNPGGSIEDIKVGDIDGDELPDIVAPNFAASIISVFRNTSIQGNFSFATAVSFAAGTNPEQIELGDMNNDGKLDIVVSYVLGKGISVFKNTSSSGGVSFDSFTDFQLGSYTYGFSIDDFNGDGMPDLAVSENGMVSLLKNTSTTAGNIRLELDNRVISFVSGVLKTGDFDNDGKVDFSIEAGLFRVVIFINKTTSPQITGFAPTQAGTGDTITISGVNFNEVSEVSFGGVTSSFFTVINSNTLKAVVGAGASGNVLVTAISGKGDLEGFSFITKPIISLFTPNAGTFGTTVTITGFNLTGTSAVYFGNTPANSFYVEGSTTIKAVVAEGSSGYVRITTPNGSDSFSGFTYTRALPPVISSFSPSAGPIGSKVIITGKNFNASVILNHVYFGPAKAKVTFATSDTLFVEVPAGAVYGNVSVTTLSMTGYSSSAFNPIFSGGGDVSANSFSDFFPLNVGLGVYDVCMADFDQDGKNDLAMATGNYAGISLFRNISGSGSMAFEPRADFATSDPTEFIRAGDIDGDGRKDIVSAGNFSFALTVFKNASVNGRLDFNGKNNYRVEHYASLRGMAISNIDNDGRPDIVLLTMDELIIIRNKSFAGTFSLDPEFFRISIGQGNLSLKTGDIDGDGKSDIIVLSGGNDSLYVFRNMSQESFAFAPATGVALSNAVDFCLGDIDKDGKIDIVAANSISPKYLSVLRNNSTLGTISFGPRTDLSNGEYQTMLIAMEELDGDGMPDIVTANDYIWRSISVLKNQSYADTIGYASKYTYPVYNNSNGIITGFCTGDLDNDGQSEIICPSGSSMIYIFKNKTTGPHVKSFYPKTGFAGTTVTVSGSNFKNVTNVRFGDKPAASFTVLSPTSITAIVDSGESGNVTVTTPLGYSSVPGFIYGLRPVITSFSPTAAGMNAYITIKGTNLSWVKDVKFGGVPASAIYHNSDTSISAVVGYGASGSVRVIGEVDSTSLPGFVYIPAPVINSFTPSSGVTGTTVTINGSNFNGTKGVYFGFVPAQSYTVVDSSKILATVGNGASGEVIVETPGGAFYKNFFRYYRRPTITSFSPTTASSGTTVTILGSDFGDASAVSFGGVESSSFTVHSENRITAVVGSGSSGRVKITAPGGTDSLDGFVYQSVPIISSFSPVTAINGSVVTIAGFNFTGTTSVSFGGTPARYFTVNSATSISAVVDNGSSGNVSVTTTQGTANLDGFTFIPPPIITSFTPTMAGEDAIISITGMNFLGTTSVKLGGIPAKSFVVNSSTNISAEVSSGATGNVSITSIGGTALLDGFIFLPLPKITSFSPSTATAGATITISGRNFDGTTGVLFGGVPCTSFSVINSTTITAVVGTGASGNVSVTTPVGTAIIPGFTFNLSTGIGDPSSNNSKDLLVSPNPGNSHIVIQHPYTSRKTVIRIVDQLGRNVRLVYPARYSKQTTTNVTGLMAGIYQIVWSDGIRILKRTLMVE